MAAVVDDERSVVRAERGPCGRQHHALDQVHHVVVVGEGLVGLQHRELRVVPGVDALVAEHPPDLEHPLHPAHDQALEVQLERDAQVEVDVEGVVVGDEGSRARPALYRLQHRALDLGEPAVLEVPADRPHGGVADPEDLPGALVDLQVDVALPVAGLDVGEPAVLVGRLAQRLAQQREPFDAHGQLAAPRRHHDAFDAHPVAAVEVVERVVALGPEHLRVDEELDRAGAVAQLREREPALPADQGEPARQADPFVRHDVGREIGVGVVDPGARGVGGPAVGVGLPAAFLGRPQLGQSVLALVGLAPGRVHLGRHMITVEIPAVLGQTPGRGGRAGS